MINLTYRDTPLGNAFRDQMEAPKLREENTSLRNVIEMATRLLDLAKDIMDANKMKIARLQEETGELKFILDAAVRWRDGVVKVRGEPSLLHESFLFHAVSNYLESHADYAQGVE
jgi:hypothetical protein